jgi:hypothetical protein
MSLILCVVSLCHYGRIIQETYIINNFRGLIFNFAALKVTAFISLMVDNYHYVTEL